MFILFLNSDSIAATTQFLQRFKFTVLKMERIDENYPTIEIPSRVQILMINEQAEEIVIDDPQQISPEQLLLMEELVTVLKRAVETENTASGELQSTSGSETAASGSETAASGSETAASGSETAASGSETAASSSETSASSSEASASSSQTSAPSEILTAEKLKELEEGVHRAIKMTIEDPSYRSLRQSFSVEISYFNISLNVNIEPQGNSN